MAFRFKQNRDSQATTQNPPSETLVYMATGSNDRNFVRDFAIGSSPQFRTHPRGTIYRQDVKVDPAGYAHWRVTVPYGPRKRELGEYSIDFDTTGGTVHLTQSLETVATFVPPGKAAAPDHGGLIGVRGDQIDGTDVVVPALKIILTFKHPAGVITIAHMKNLARWTGRTNSTPFLTFAAGEVLFMGASGREGTEVDTEIRYQFAASENQVGEAVGLFAAVDKKGWEYAWILPSDDVDAGEPVKKPRALYVERVNREIDMAAALGFGA